MEPTAREFEALTASMKELTGELRALPDKLLDKVAETYARKDVIIPRIEAVEKDVQTHGSYFRWLVQIVMGLVIVALLGTVLVQNGVVR